VRVTFVSDIHGNVEALAKVAARAELLVVLGDLLDYVDYHDPGNGILGQVFGADRVLEFTALRSAHDFVALRTLNETLWAGVADPLGTLTEVVSRRYRQIADALTGPTLLTLGNVDVLEIWRAVAGDDLPCLDGNVVERGGYRFGFVGGGSARPGHLIRLTDHVWQPFVRSADDFAGRLDALGRVDVLCTHIPPDIDVLRYDQVPARLEMYGPGVLEYVDAHHPSYALFGHVHQPLAARTRRGRTECVNVGHFQRTGRPYVLELAGR
jgi:Icc-related predicted phosphoesterase